MPEDHILTDAIALAERILDRLTAPRPDWQAVRKLAVTLAMLAEHATGER
jgi:hypothetical protein